MAPGQYFESSPSTPSRPSEVVLALPDGTVTLRSDRGVFSAGHVDPGTMILLRAVPPAPASGTLVDLGCGYGPIACTLARRSPDARVWAVDVNRRALALTTANAEALGLGNLRGVIPDDFPNCLAVDGLYSNPPIRIGKAALQELLAAWLPRLAPGAAAWLVVQRHLGADSLADWLAGAGYVVRRAGSKRGYRVLEVRPPAAVGMPGTVGP